MGIIKGRVTGARPGQRIVLYAGGTPTWWVQPFADQPFTEIHPDLSWSSSTHPGAEYAALLVGPDFHPPQITDALPREGVLASAVTKGLPPVWQRLWFVELCLTTAAFLIFGIHRIRLRQMSKVLNRVFEERLAERARVAQELHDTLLQGVLSTSMHLHVAVDQLPADSPALPAMNHVLELMSQVVQEGRNTLRGLRSSIDSAQDLQSALSRIPQEVGKPGGNFRVVVEGTALPLRPTVRDDVYRIGREALVNAFRHSQARNIDLYLEYSPNQLRIVVRDDGCGIDPQVLHSGRDGHLGLPGIRERAENIGAKVKVLSRVDGGTEVELCVPSNIAFESRPSGLMSKWLAGFRRQQNNDELTSK
jgi:signal transduction histidine kinase